MMDRHAHVDRHAYVDGDAMSNLRGAPLVRGAQCRQGRAVRVAPYCARSSIKPKPPGGARAGGSKHWRMCAMCWQKTTICTMKRVYHPSYQIALPAAHPFPMSKYSLLKDQLAG